MATYSPDWDACASLQNQLSNTYIDGARSAGLEGALDSFVENAFQQRKNDSDELERAASTARRGHRRRTALMMRRYPPPTTVDPRPALEAASTLSRLERSIPHADWKLVVAIAEGQTYGDLAAQGRVTAQSLRVSVHRSRRRLATYVADETGKVPKYPPAQSPLWV
jgi:hypothetical protein